MIPVLTPKSELLNVNGSLLHDPKALENGEYISKQQSEKLNSESNNYQQEIAYKYFFISLIINIINLRE